MNVCLRYDVDVGFIYAGKCRHKGYDRIYLAGARHGSKSIIF